MTGKPISYARYILSTMSKVGSVQHPAPLPYATLLTLVFIHFGVCLTNEIKETKLAPIITPASLKHLQFFKTAFEEWKFVKDMNQEELDVAFTNYGEYWRQMSTCMLQPLNTTRVRSFRSTREEKTALMVEKIVKSIPSVVNLTEAFVTLSNDVICRTAFGRKYAGDESGNFGVLLKKFAELLGKFVVGDFVRWLGWILVDR
ncbi:hypothetical protein Cgig2_033175 [Carnegiea gigantea]|uniref:Uncharacterized protein n=1 Tax=Carnegiea gigantea TaxID=171969 RepID=A0A9Q1JUK4_9CARY|nr:hypothetical protein Cgig2_033175 [Carnegiea gigantea]